MKSVVLRLFYEFSYLNGIYISYKNRISFSLLFSVAVNHNVGEIYVWYNIYDIKK